MDISTLITDANLLLSAAIAFAAGLVSFASPCVVPLVPGYLAYMTGLSSREIAAADTTDRLRVLTGALLFVLGFAIPFTLLGLLGGGLSRFLAGRPQQIIMGLIVVLLGLAFTGLVPLGLLRREARFTDKAPDAGVLGAAPLGFVFGVGWTPCIGPALGAIFSLSVATGAGSPARGAFLAFIYSLGLGLPFVLVGVLFNRLERMLGFLRRNARRLQVAGGVMLSLVGVAIATGLWNRFIIAVRPMIQGFEPPI